MNVALAPHHPGWAARAAQEADRWRAALGPALVALHHIGSTAIPGIAAKPIIDMIPEFTDAAALDAARDIVESLGYEWLGAYGLPGRRYCRRDVAGRRAFQVHCYPSGHPDISRHLAFRDLMRADPALARAYEAEKRRCAAVHPDDVGAYTDCKSDWIRQAEARALEARIP